MNEAVIKCVPSPIPLMVLLEILGPSSLLSGSALVDSVWQGGGVLAKTGWNFSIFREYLILLGGKYRILWDLRRRSIPSS
jgi:hypothetical protein